LLAGPALAQQVLPAQSEIAFVSRQMGVPVEGTFKQVGGADRFDPKQAEAGSVGFTIETGSASFGSAETDAEVPKATWFNVAKFPKASFQSSAIKATGRRPLRGGRQAGIKGSTRDVVVPVTITQITQAAPPAPPAAASPSSGWTSRSAKASGPTPRWWPTT
jgi:polyisoprenoid-binding protein YceI